MPIFNKPGQERVDARTDSIAVPEAALSIIAAGMKVIGDIESSGVIRIDGHVEGAVRGTRQLLLGKTGSVHGDVHADEAVLAGTVVGKVVASQRVEVQGSCSIQGDIHTKSVVVLEGGVINGTVRMDGAGKPNAHSTPTSARQALALSQ